MGSKKNAWLKFDDAKKQEIFHFCEGYKKYISDCKTEENQLRSYFFSRSKGYRDLKECYIYWRSL